MRSGPLTRDLDPSWTWRALTGCALAAAVATGAACSGNQTPMLHAAAGEAPPGAESSAAPTSAGAPGDWTLPGRDPEGTRFSPLTQITADNVKTLKVAWTFSTGYARGFEGQPLVVNNTMYVVSPYPNTVYALDLTHAGGPAKWVYKPPTAAASQGEACCDVVNRGAAYANGKVVFNRLDDHTVAIDASTGATAWDTQLDSIDEGATMTMAPLIVGNVVVVGNSGAELGVHGWIAGLDLATGKLLWRAYNTGPDSVVKIGSEFKPFYAQYKGKDLGVSTWPADQWKLGGGTVWGWVTYDPELKEIYYGSANPGVWNPDMRPGDNLWGATLFARDPQTGNARWAYQTTPHDSWDYDAVNESIPVDIPINGQPRKVVVHFDRNGFAYTIDRQTGEVLVAQPFQDLNWATGIDLKTGRPDRVPSKQTHQGVNTTDICPSSTGARDQQPAAFSPRTNLFYTPSTKLCMDYAGLKASYIAGTPYLGADVRNVSRTRSMEPSRRSHRMGPRQRQEGLGHPRALSRVEWSRRHRERHPLLRHHGRVVQGGRRQDGSRAVAVQVRLGDRRQSDHLCGPGRQAVCRRILGDRRVDGRDRSRPLGLRSHGRAWCDRRDAGSTTLHCAGRHGVRVLAVRPVA